MKTKSEVLIGLFKDSKICVDKLFEIAKNDSDIDILFEIVNKNNEFLNKTTFDIVLNSNEVTEKSIFILEKIISEKLFAHLDFVDEFFLLKMLLMRSPDYKQPCLPSGKPYMRRCPQIKAFELFITNKILNNFTFYLDKLIKPSIKSYKTNSIVREYLKNIILQKLSTVNNPLDLLELYNSPTTSRNGCDAMFLYFFGCVAIFLIFLAFFKVF